MSDFTKTNVSRRTRANNLYSIITGAGQYKAGLEKPDFKPNSYEPPIGENSNSDEVAAWENAKRLSATLYIAIEDYGEENEYSSVNDRNEHTVGKGDRLGYQEICIGGNQFY